MMMCMVLNIEVQCLSEELDIGLSMKLNPKWYPLAAGSLLSFPLLCFLLTHLLLKYINQENSVLLAPALVQALLICYD